MSNSCPNLKPSFIGHKRYNWRLSISVQAPKHRESPIVCVPIRALQAYVDATRDLRKSQQLFVSYKTGSQGFPVTKRRISSWIVEAIKTCYALEKLDPPKNVHAHETRAQASSWAAFSGVDPTRICRAAVWSILHTLCKHYRTHQLWEGRGISTEVLSAASNDNP